MCNDAVRQLQYYVNNPSAWEDGFSQNVSDAIERALVTHPADGDSPAGAGGLMTVAKRIDTFRGENHD